jgi:hypothetical protein
MQPLKGFIAGALAVPLFHQTMLALLKAAAVTDRGAFNMDPTRPFEVPALVSLAFWGGVWGVIFALAVSRERFSSPAGFWTAAALFGAIAPTLVAWFVVAPLKGQPLGGGFKPAGMLTALLINGAWGVGTAILLLLMRTVRQARERS